MVAESGCLFRHLCPDLHPPQDISWPLLPSHHHRKMATQCHLRRHRYQYCLWHHILRPMHFRMRQSIPISPPLEFESMRLDQECCDTCILHFQCSQRCHGLDNGSTSYQYHPPPEHAGHDEVLGLLAHIAGCCWQHRLAHSICICWKPRTERHVLQKYWQACLLLSYRARTWNSGCMLCDSSAAGQTMCQRSQVRVQHPQESRPQRQKYQRHWRLRYKTDQHTKEPPGEGRLRCLW